MDAGDVLRQIRQVPGKEIEPQPLEAPITTLRGVGPERAMLLARLGIRTITDLLVHRPRRYEDRRHFLAIRDVAEKGPATLRGKVVALGVKLFRQRRQSLFQLVLDDGTARLHCRWWNMPFLEGCFAVGQELMVHGKVLDLKPRTIDHPETELIEEEGEEASVHMHRIVPIYPLTEGLSQRWLRERAWAVVESLADGVAEPRPGVATGDLPTRAQALRWVHFPGEMTAVRRGLARLAFDEFVELQLAIQLRRRRLQSHGPGHACGGDNRWIRPFLAGLGFKLTSAQTDVLREIRQDMLGGEPMRRLVQGDVGCGKTVVAAVAALMALESGFDVALMAPTEILARQHTARFESWLQPLGIRVRICTGAWKTGESTSGSLLDSDEPGLTIGTHALLETSYAPGRLGLVIIDEQHKFGVGQREWLVRKGHYPHLLVMTATPIPRTLALTLYGDLDVSVIAHGPPGRGRIRTFVRSRDKLPKVWNFVREQVASGRQAYIVYARVSDEGAGETKAVVREFETLAAGLAPAIVGLLHGRLDPEEKDRVMRAFAAGEIDVLLATSVIEVGVDVPNATVMVVENAERFGLAQLHQLRGRIGRGGNESFCILVPARETEEIRGRLEVLERSSDGFAIAEADLALRGPGELLGQAQSGLPSLRFGDLARDRELLETARSAVADFLRTGGIELKEEPAREEPAAEPPRAVAARE